MEAQIPANPKTEQTPIPLVHTNQGRSPLLQHHFIHSIRSTFIIYYTMNKKHKLSELRHIVQDMQHQLVTLEKENQAAAGAHRQSPSRPALQSLTALRERGTNGNKWEKRKESAKRSIQKYKQISESVDRQYYTYVDGRTASPKNQGLQKVISHVDKNYYEGSVEWVPEKENFAAEQRQGAPEKKETRKRFAIFQHSTNQQTPRLTPHQLLNAHPLSNQHLKFLANKGIVCRGKGALSSRKNRSLIFGGADRVQAHHSCSKRHFDHYFADHFTSCSS